MRVLRLDYEVSSRVDLKKCGVDVYSRDKSTRVLMLAYAFDDDKPRIWEPHLGPMPAHVRKAISDPSVRKTAFNSAFEIAITRNTLGIPTEASQWHCTMVMSLSLGMPGKMEILVRDALRLDKEFWKDPKGDKLIQKFCYPAGAARYPEPWRTHPEEWEQFVAYCLQDVVAETKAYKILSRYIDNIDDLFEWWQLDQKINQRGIPVDYNFIDAALDVAARAKATYVAAMKKLTGLANPNSNTQILPWLQERGYPFASLAKNKVVQIMREEDVLSDDALEALQLRLDSNKTSIAKFDAIVRASFGGRLRNVFQFLGAAATGRWAGRVLGQNIPRPWKKVEDYLAHARAMIQERDLEEIIFWFGKPLEVVVSSIRSAIKAPFGKKFVVADLSSIELVVIAWLTDCKFWLDVVHSGKDAYKAFAEQWLGVPYADVTKAQRNLSKPPALGCFDGDTRVLTDRGWVAIMHVRSGDRVFDGVEFVSHDGVVNQGVKRVIDMHGVLVTPDHLIIREDEWVEAAKIAKNATESWLGLTYDILNAGPRSRFMIHTNIGPMVAHNCGYRMGPGRRITLPNGDEAKTGLWGYGADMGVDLTKDQCKEAVKIYRGLSPEIVDWWYKLEQAAMDCVDSKEPQKVGRIMFDIKAPFLRMRLPSGRYLHYCRPRIEQVEIEFEDEKTGEVVVSKKIGLTYERVDQKSGKWVRRSTHGGVWVEQLTQATARDILANGIKNAEDAGLNPIFHFHDEVGCEVDEEDTTALGELIECMTRKLKWADDKLRLRAEGYENPFYKKG